MSLEIAVAYLKNGFSVIPLNKNKAPKGTWKAFQKKAMNQEQAAKYDWTYLGIVCGVVSGDLEVIDVDTKNDLTGQLWEELAYQIANALPELRDKFYVVQTPSGGYHIYYRCKDLERSKKLAFNEKHEVIIETKSQGGQVAGPPFPNYLVIQGSLNDIPTISKEERETIMAICKSFDQLPAPEPRPVKKPSLSLSTPYQDSPFDDFNARGDVIDLLQEHGWSVVGQDQQRIYLKRPGDSKAKNSGNYHIEKRLFKSFSTSTEFEAEKAYSPASVVVQLLNNDNQAAYRYLLSKGYGSEPKRTTKSKPMATKKEETPLNPTEIWESVRTHNNPMEDWLEFLNAPDPLETHVIVRHANPEIGDERLSIAVGGLTFVGALTGGGKTLFKVSLAYDQVFKRSRKAVWITFEESVAETLIRFILAHLKDIEDKALYPKGAYNLKNEITKYLRNRPSKIPEGLKRHVDNAKEEMMQAYDDKRLVIVDGTKLTTDQLYAACEGALKEHDIVFVDYIQKISYPEAKQKQGHEHLGDIAKQLEIVAKKTRKSIVAGAQLKQDIKSPDQIDNYSLQGSSTLAQYAKVIALLWNCSTPIHEKQFSEALCLYFPEAIHLGPDQDNNKLFVMVYKWRFHATPYKTIIPYNARFAGNPDPFNPLFRAAGRTKSETIKEIKDRKKIDDEL